MRPVEMCSPLTVGNAAIIDLLLSLPDVFICLLPDDFQPVQVLTPDILFDMGRFLELIVVHRAYTPLIVTSIVKAGIDVMCPESAKVINIDELRWQKHCLGLQEPDVRAHNGKLQGEAVDGC